MRDALTLPSAFPARAALTIDVFRGLYAFRRSSDERRLQELFCKLCDAMPEQDADRILSDALALDNEIRFRVPSGLSLREPGEDEPSAHEKALAILVAHAQGESDRVAALMAESLGIGHHQVLREYAAKLAQSLRAAGFDPVCTEAPFGALADAAEAGSRIGI